MLEVILQVGIASLKIVADVAKIRTKIEYVDSIAAIETLMRAGDRRDAARASRRACSDIDVLRCFCLEMQHGGDDL